MCYSIYKEAQQFTQQTQPNDLKQDLFIEQGTLIPSFAQN